MPSNYFKKPKFLISLCLILGGLGSLLFGFYPIFASLLIIIGILGSLFSYLSSESRNQQLDSIIEIQATLLARHGLGNTYTEIFKKELFKTGSVKKGRDLLIKALEVNPNDIDALELLAMSLALNLSFFQWIGKNKDSVKLQRDLSYAKSLAHKGLSIDPKRYGFLDILGILYDFDGNHAEARKQFIKSSKLRDDPYGHLFMATSWHQSNEHKKALSELQIAEKEGAEGWLFESYYGRAYNSVGDYEKALIFLLPAYKKRGNKPELVSALAESYYLGGRFLKASKYEFILGSYLLLIYPRKGVFRLSESLLHMVMAFVCFVSKKCWTVEKYIPGLRLFPKRICSPDEPEFTLGNMLLKKGNYEGAERNFRIACEIIPEKAESHANLALCLAIQGLTKEALFECDKSIELNPQNELFKYAKQQIQSGNIKRIVDQNGNVIKIL